MPVPDERAAPLDSPPTTTVTVPETSPEPTAVYVIEQAAKYVGTQVSHPATDQIIDGFEFYGRFVGTKGGGIFTFKQGTASALEFLALVIPPDNRVTDALKLITNGDEVFLEALSDDQALVLREGPLADYGTTRGRVLHRWIVDVTGHFVESEPATGLNCSSG